MTNERITLLEQLLREAEKYVLRTLEHGRSEGLLHTRGDAENAMLLVQIRNALSGEQGIPANKDDDKVRALSAFHCDFGCDVPAHKPGCPFHKGSSPEPTGDDGEVMPHGVIFDKLGWCCSVCGGWNHAQDKFCTHTHTISNEPPPENRNGDV